MKRIVIAILAVIAAVSMEAQTPQAMLDKCVAAINASGGVTANYSIITNQGTSSGTIAMRMYSVVYPA